MQFFYGGFMDSKQKQNVLITNRERLVINEVNSVLSFDEDYLRIDTAFGIITAEGSGLVIDGLTKETGEIVILGKINSIEFSESKKKK